METLTVEQKGRVTTATLSIQGMHCPTCAIIIDSALEALPGVTWVRTDMSRARTHVEFDADAITLAHIAAAIAEVGYAVTLP